MQILQHAQRTTKRKVYRNQVEACVSEFVNIMGESLNETGKFVYPGFGSFRVNKSGKVTFTPSPTFEKKVSGFVGTTDDE